MDLVNDGLTVSFDDQKFDSARRLEHADPMMSLRFDTTRLDVSVNTSRMVLDEHCL